MNQNPHPFRLQYEWVLDDSLFWRKIDFWVGVVALTGAFYFGWSIGSVIDLPF